MAAGMVWPPLGGRLKITRDATQKLHHSEVEPLKHVGSRTSRFSSSSCLADWTLMHSDRVSGCGSRSPWALRSRWVKLREQIASERLDLRRQSKLCEAM